MVQVKEISVKMDSLDIGEGNVASDIEMEEWKSWEWSYDIVPELAKFLPKVVLQIGDTCIHNAIATAHEIKLREMKNEWECLSRKHIILNWLKNVGVTTDNCYTSHYKPGDGRVFRIKGYRPLNVYDPQSIIDEIMFNGPIAIELSMYADFFELTANDIYKGNGKMVEGRSSSYQKLHAVCGIGGGYDKAKEPFYRFLNSWGNYKGTNGLGKTYARIGRNLYVQLMQLIWKIDYLGALGR